MGIVRCYLRCVYGIRASGFVIVQSEIKMVKVSMPVKLYDDCMVSLGRLHRKGVTWTLYGHRKLIRRQM